MNSAENRLDPHASHPCRKNDECDALQDHLHPHALCLPVRLGEDLLDDQAQVGVERIALVVARQVAGEDLHVPRLVHHLHGGGELAVQVGHLVHELSAHHERGLLAVQHLRQREEPGLPEQRGLLGLGEIVHGLQAAQEVVVAGEDGNVGLEAPPVDVDLGIPLLALRLAVEGVELGGVESVVVAEDTVDEGVGRELGQVHRDLLGCCGGAPQLARPARHGSSAAPALRLGLFPARDG